MAERENRQDGENTQSGRDGYKSYNREGYNRYNRNEEGNNYGRRPRFASNNEGGERPQRSYNSRYNNNGEGGEQRPYRPRFNSSQQGEGGYRQQRSYGNRPSYDNNNGERASYNPNFNNSARPRRAIILVIIMERMVSNVLIVRVSITHSREREVTAHSVLALTTVASRVVTTVRREEAIVLVQPTIIRMLSIA